MKGTTESQGFTDYLSVFDGKFAKRVKEPTANSTTRETASKKIVHEVYYTYVSGILQTVEKRDSDYGFNLHLLLVDADEKNSVTIKLYDSTTRTILNKLPNVDRSKPITLLVGKNNEGRTWFSIKQAGRGFKDDTVPNAVELSTLPKPQTVKMKGKEVTSFDEQIDILWANMEAALAKAPAPAAPAKKELESSMSTENSGAFASWDAPTTPTDGTDDLPF